MVPGTDTFPTTLYHFGPDINTYLIKGWEEELIMAKVPEVEWDAAINALALPTVEGIGQPSIGDTLDVEMETIFGDPAAWALPTNVEVEVIKGELVGVSAE